MTIALFGGNEYIGNHVYKRLMNCDEHIVNQVEYTCDVSSYEILLFLGHDFTPPQSDVDPVLHIQKSLIPIVELLRKTSSKYTKKIVFLSTGGLMHRNANELLIEPCTNVEPFNNYAIIKRCIEDFLLYNMRQKQISTIIFRESNIYGPGQQMFNNPSFIHQVINSVKSKQVVQLINKGLITRDYLYIDDIVELLLSSVSSSVSGIYNAAYGQSVTSLYVVNKIQEILNLVIPYKFVRVPHDRIVGMLNFDISKTIKDFSWKPRIDVDEGIRRIINQIVEV